MRLHAQTAVIENGFVHIPKTAPWLAEYLHELTVFPNGKHDDQADSTAQFLDWFKKPFPGQGLSTSTTASARKNSRSSASRNPSRPYGRSGPWNGRPTRRKRTELRRPWSRYLSQATQQQGATTELAVPGDRKFESISLRGGSAANYQEFF
jgi:hypothetical protein